MLAPTIVKPRKRHSKQFLHKTNLDVRLNKSFLFIKKTILTISECTNKYFIFQNSYEIGILRQFPFSSTLQCMSVICRNTEDPHMIAFTKGAPEKIHGLCLPETIPLDFNTRLSHYTTCGYRVIAIAYKELPKRSSWKEMQKCKRDVVSIEIF